MKKKSALIFFCLLVCLPKIHAGEEDGLLVQAPSNVAVYDLWEARITGKPTNQLVGSMVENRLRAEIILPDGTLRKVSGFHYFAYERARDANNHEQLTPLGGGEWRVRYCPEMSGLHKVTVFVAAEDGQNISASTAFVASKPAKMPPGFLHSGANHVQKLVFDNGEPVFLLGHNVCWVARENGTYGYDEYFRKMAENGENYTRIWLCTWGLNLQTIKPYEVEQTGAWRLDQVLTMAQDCGIYVKLCFDNFYDFQHNWNDSPFNARNGGPCRTRAEFFTTEKARQQQLARIRYLIARYGSYRSLLAWEIWNETDYTLYSRDFANRRPSTDEIRDQVLLPWTLEMAGEIRRIDPYKHPVTSSLGLNQLWPELWKDARIDLAQYHCYINSLEYSRRLVERDAAAFALESYERVAKFGKPALVGEFGYMGQGSSSQMNLDDPTGIALHNSLWAGLMSGGAGVPMLWWWDNYIEPNDLYYHYKGVAEFIRDVDWKDEFAPMRAENETLRILALRGQRQSLVWLQNRDNIWYRRVKQKLQLSELQDVAVTLRNFAPGRYRLEWFDPYAAKVISTYELDAPDGDIRLQPESFKTDVAVRLLKLR
jgi:hypothetical protein